MFSAVAHPDGWCVRAGVYVVDVFDSEKEANAVAEFLNGVMAGLSPRDDRVKIKIEVSNA